MERNFKLTSIMLTAFLLIGCNKEKFDSSKWQPVENGLYGNNHRKKMLDDLVDNVLKFPVLGSEKGTKKSNVIKLIGKPFATDCNNNDIYEIEEKIGMIDPNGYAYLKLKYDADSTLLGYIIEDANYKE